MKSPQSPFFALGGRWPPALLKRRCGPPKPGATADLQALTTLVLGEQGPAHVAGG